MTFGSQINCEVFLKVEKAINCQFYLSTSGDKKVRAAKDDGKKFRSNLATSFSVIRDLEQEEAVK